MIETNDRKSLVEYRIHQAEETTELAAFLLENNKLTLAVNRIYYGMYYALTALAIQNSFETSKHAPLIGWFNKEFIASGKLDKKYGKILRNAFQNRTKSDYDAFIEFTQEEVDVLLFEMKEFILKIKSQL